MKIKAADVLVIILLFISVFFIKNLFVPSGTPSLILITEKGEKELSFRDQLYDLKEDAGEKENVAAKYEEKVKELKALLKSTKLSHKF